MSLKNICVIGFDLDGTLYEITPEIQKKMRGKIYEKISEKFEVPFEKARDLFEERYVELMSGSKTIDEISRQYSKKINGSDFIQEALQEADFLDLMGEDLRLNHMLIRLRERKRKSLDLLTGSTPSFTLRKLEKLEINPHVFDYILTNEDGLKSHEEIYRKWIGTRNLPPKNFLYVGDNPKQDIDIPKSLGIKTCIVGSYEDADFNISNILDLENLLE